MTIDTDRLLGREFEVDLQRFTVVAIDPDRGLKLYVAGNVLTATWVSFAFWAELIESGLLNDAAPLRPAMPLKTGWRRLGARP